MIKTALSVQLAFSRLLNSYRKCLKYFSAGYAVLQAGRLAACALEGK